jgi:competence protein ComEC
MIRACLYLLAGNYALQLSSFTPDSDLFAAGLVASIVCIIVGRFDALLFFVVGAALFLLASSSVIDSRIDPRFAGDSIVTTVRVADFPKQNGPTVSLLAETSDDVHVPRRLRVSWHEPPSDVRLGDIWQLELRLRRPRGGSNPGVFDYEAWLFRERIGAVGYVVSGPRNRLIRSGELSVTERIRQRVVDRITGHAGITGVAGVLAAISVGARHLITAHEWQRYAMTGTSHLMAISGLHVGLAAAGGYFLAAFAAPLLCRRGNHHLVATAAATLTAAAYAALSGLAIPAQRAALMIGLAAIAILRRQQVAPVTVIATVCVGILLTSPLATMAPGFKLSFAAVIALVWMSQQYHGRPQGGWPSRVWQASRQLGEVQGMLLFGLAPLTVLIFDRIAFAAPLVNLLAVPVFTAVTVPFTLAGILLDGALQPAGDLALLIAATSLEGIAWLIARAAELPGADFATPRIAPAAWLFVALPAAWVVLPPAWPGRGLAVLAFVALAFHQPQRPVPGCAELDVLDVGQGLAIVVTTQRHAVVFDTGPAYRGGGSAATAVLLPVLQYRAITRIDKLVVSHGDLDHAGGVQTVTSHLDVADIRLGESLAGPGTTARRCIAGDDWGYDGVRFEFLHPRPGSVHTGNDASCVLMISAGAHSVLLTGDIERPVEEELVRTGRASRVDAVVVPHHGSRTSSSLPFVTALSPSLAIVSAGHGNRWGFPKAEVVARWQGVGAEVLATSRSGAITIRLCNKGGVVSVIERRTAQRRIWHE